VDADEQRKNEFMEMKKQPMTAAAFDRIESTFVYIMLRVNNRRSGLAFPYLPTPYIIDININNNMVQKGYFPSKNALF
jgi:hypothetical protein